MSATLAPFDRPRRWDIPFSEETTDADVTRLLALAPFNAMKPESFPRNASLANILKNDARIRRFEAGEIVVREGDYGTSAFMILAGTARVVVEPGLPRSLVGRREPSRHGFLRTLARLWTNAKEDEVAQRGRLANRARQRAGDRRIVIQDIPRVLDQHHTAVLSAGDYFGEIAALSRMPRTATIIAMEGAEFLEMRWQGLRDLMRYDPAMRLYIDRIYRERALATYLAEIPFMRYLSAASKKRVMEATQFETYGEYDWSGDYKRLAQSGAPAAREQAIATEGDYPNGVVLIRAGFARMTQHYGEGHRTLNYLGSGGLYGFDEIAHNWRQPENSVPLQYTLRVMGYTHVLVIPAQVIEQVVLPAIPVDELPPLVKTDTGSRSPYVHAGKTPSKTDAPIAPDMMEFLTQNRLFNGTASMFIDLDRCTRCDDCVRACASAHDNNPRFLRSGPIHENVMVAQACMHCADPVCMIGCPTGAIHRDAFEGEVVINPASCIGCSTCANSCPYGAIRMVELRDTTGEVLMAHDGNPLLGATKCDLCIDEHHGPACERACPHDALKRINLNTLDMFVSWMKR